MMKSNSLDSFRAAGAFWAAWVAMPWVAPAQVPGATTNKFDEKTIQQWALKGPLSEPPKRLTEELPWSDQQNRGGWQKFAPLWDEFEGPGLDTNKWRVGMAWWRGRAPAWFNPTNVTVREGRLHLTMRKETVPQELQSRGYHDYSSAALHTRARSSYGYYEVKARPMDSGGSSSFWFQQGNRSRVRHDGAIKKSVLDAK
jgi:hypothetical protein